MSPYGEDVESVQRKNLGEVVEGETVESVFRVEHTNGDVEFFRVKDGERIDATKKEWDAIKDA